MENFLLCVCACCQLGEANNNIRLQITKAIGCHKNFVGKDLGQERIQAATDSVVGWLGYWPGISETKEQVPALLHSY